MFKNSAALISAVKAGNAERVRQVLAKGAEARSRDALAWSALHIAASAGNTEIVLALLDAGADANAIAPTTEAVDRSNYEGSATALMVALRGGHSQVALTLIERGADVSHEDAFSGEDALFIAAQRGLLAVVERLLQGVQRPVGRSGYQQQTALTAAIGSDSVDVATLLLANGYPPDANAFCTACRRGHVGLLARLVHAGADVNRADGHQTPFAAAARSGQIAVLEWLNANGAATSLQVEHALLGAAGSDHVGVVRWLANHGANLDVRDVHGWTPVMHAAWQGNADCVLALLSLGANPAIADAQGKTPLDWATTGKHEDVVRILKAHSPPRRA